MTNLPFDETKMSVDEIREAILNGYTPKMDDLIDHPILRENEWFIMLAFSYDPNIIRFLPKEIIDEKLCKDSLDRGFLIRYDDILSYDYLFNFKCMRKDLYDKFYIDLDKVDILDEKINSLSYYLFNDDYSFIKDNNIKSIIKKYNVDENNMNLEQKYMSYFNKFVEGLAHSNYIKDKTDYRFNSVNVIDDFIKEEFDLSTDISVIANCLYNYVNNNQKDFISFDYILIELNRIYELYLNNDLSRSDSIDFYNEILNDLQNRIEYENKIKLKEEYKLKFSLSDKKKESILKGKQLEKITELIKNKDYCSLNTSEESIKKDLEKLNDYILKIKDIKKSNIIITKDIFNKFNKLFLQNGTLSLEEINEEINNYEISKIILKKYNNFKLKYKVKLNESNEINKEKVSLNYNNYKIFDKRRFCKNIATFLLKYKDNLEKDDLKILNDILPILNFCNIIDEFTVDDFIKIISFFKTIKYNIIISSNNLYKDDLDMLFVHFYEFLNISRKFATSNGLSDFVFDSNFIETVKKYTLNEYLKLYVESFKRYYGTIPKVQGTFEEDNYQNIEKYTFESSNYKDKDRLLIGYINNSCLRIDNIVGSDTLVQCITDPNSDIILIKDKNYKKVGRILIFRKGNIIQLAPIFTAPDFIINDETLVKLLNNITNQIINEVKKNNDNIDFIFYNTFSTYLNEVFVAYANQDFHKKFPHADLFEKVYVLYFNKSLFNDEDLSEDYLFKKKITLNLRFDDDPVVRYLKDRINIKKDATIDEINALKVIRIESEKNPNIKQKLREQFLQELNIKYVSSILGEDFFIGKREDGSIEEFLINTNDERAFEEFIDSKKMMNKRYKI